MHACDAIMLAITLTLTLTYANDLFDVLSVYVML